MRAALLSLALLLAVAYAFVVLHGRSAVVLVSKGEARWIRPNVEMFPRLKLFQLQRIVYSTVVNVPSKSTGVEVDVSSLGEAALSLDQTSLPADTAASTAQIQSRVFHIPASFAGSHRLDVEVTHSSGPALVRVALPALNVFSGASWECSADGVSRSPVALADTPESFTLPETFSPSPAQALTAATLPVLLLVLSGLLMTGRRRVPNPAKVRLVLIALWLVLAGVDMAHVSVAYGFDAGAHFQYFDFILDHHRLPFGNEGWQLFQGPLFYLVSTLLWALLKIYCTHDTAGLLIRVVPIGCGCVMIELVYRTLRVVYPDRLDLQCVGLVVGGLLPVNLYMMQFPSNEPFMAVFAAAVAWSVCRWLAKPNLKRPWRPAAVTGILLGLAVLSKVSAIIWLAPVALAYAGPLLGQPRRWRRIAGAYGVLAGGVIVVAGWWFVRNQLALGVPFLAHSGGDWWQDPGYRTPADFYRFGVSLTHPVVLEARSVWDSIYSSFWADAYCSGVIGPAAPPPWNVRLMLLCQWFALLPTALILIAAGVALFARYKPSIVRSAALFAAVSIGCFVAAVVHVYLTLPIYSCAKASYMMGATPCFAILIAAGFDHVPRRLRKPAAACLVTVAGLAYATFFVLAN